MDVEPDSYIRSGIWHIGKTKERRDSIIEKYPGIKADTVYSLAESRLHMFSGEIKIPEYEAPCDCNYFDDEKKYQKDCEDCHGKGVRKTTSNPLFQYDFFHFGDDWLNRALENSIINFVH